MKLHRRQLFGAALAAGFAGANSPAIAQSEQPIQPIARPSSGLIRVAFLVDRFHNVLDFAGSWEAFQSAGDEREGFELFTVSPMDQEFRLNTVTARADYLCSNAPQPNVVFMGAQSFLDGPSTDDIKSEWLRRVEPQADIVMSVCTGAFVLARSGLIDGRMATTHHAYYDNFAEQFPNVHLVRDRSFVDNGKFVSGGGLTTGVDATLHVIARYFGPERAVRVANYLEHYSDGWRTGARLTPA